MKFYINLELFIGRLNESFVPVPSVLVEALKALWIGPLKKIEKKTEKKIEK